MTALRYLTVFSVLLVLTGTTFGLSFLNLGVWEWPIALGIASAKGVLIALYFMHLVEMSSGHRLSAVVAAILLVVLVLFTLSDVWTRVLVAPKVETEISGAAQRANSE